MDQTNNEVPALRLRWSGQTHRGKVRKNNEDSFLALRFDAQELDILGRIGEVSTQSNDFVFAVSDGMGGAMAGEFASRITVDKVTRLLPRTFQHSAGGLPAGFEDVLGELFTQVHRSLLFLGESDEECAGMGATLSVCWFTPGWMRFGHVGDSRIYHLAVGATELKQLTQDDTHVGWLFRQGLINEREARNHPRRNVLQKVLGAGSQFVDPQVGAVGLVPGDVFLLCTDGLTDGIYDKQMAEIILQERKSEPARHLAEALLQAALETPARDNVTALVVEVLPA